MRFYANGLGESLGGDALATQLPIITSGNVWWVNSVTGTDAASPAGQDREKPLATLVQANTNATDGDIIVLENGHVETMTVLFGALKAVTVVGIGTTSGKPGAQLKINAAAAGLISTATGVCELRNIYFPAAVQSDTTANGKIRIASTPGVVISGCYFESSANDQLPAISIDVASNNVLIENCTFVSTATTTATRPLRGIYLAGAVTDLRIIGCTFDDGTVGYANGACDLSGATITRLRCHSNTFLRGADLAVASATTGYFALPAVSGGGRVSW
jgi:hypothetical protein